MWSTAESQTLRIPSFFADQKYSIKLKSSENFSFFVCTVQILWSCEVSKNQDLAIFSMHYLRGELQWVFEITLAEFLWKVDEEKLKVKI